MSWPLEGIRIVELGTQTPGKQCTGLLADLGADVIRVERPGAPTQITSEDRALNRSKRSLTLDLRRPAGRQALFKLCRGVDVFLEGNRPGTAAKLGLGFDDLRSVNPRIVYCSLSSFGQDGPLATLPAFDIVTQARAGLLSIQAGPGRAPATPRLYLADFGGAMMAAIGILMGLVARDRTGEGTVVDVSMLDGLLWWFCGLLGPDALAGRPAQEVEDNPGYTTYETADSRWLALGVFRASSWATLCELLEYPEFVQEQWAEPTRQRFIRAQFAARLKTRPVVDWLALFEQHDIEAGPCNSLEEALRSEQARVRGMLLQLLTADGGTQEQVGVPLKFSGTGRFQPRVAPTPGQDTRSILAELGYGPEQFAEITGGAS
jgi:alpha-methylacyl-CoA racemase